mmetsp:Transcript_20188/g.80584  ORF Transcript_20188/g.80584 Transcript_20188/m.80584 type:complete len:217 (-) Transcript_20188:676-1326(-)
MRRRAVPRARLGAGGVGRVARRLASDVDDLHARRGRQSARRRRGSSHVRRARRRRRRGHFALLRAAAPERGAPPRRDRRRRAPHWIITVVQGARPARHAVLSAAAARLPDGEPCRQRTPRRHGPGPAGVFGRRDQRARPRPAPRPAAAPRRQQQRRGLLLVVVGRSFFPCVDETGRRVDVRNYYSRRSARCVLVVNSRKRHNGHRETGVGKGDTYA